MTGQNVVVTGGAGFIGSELVAQLLAEGAKVRVVDNLVNGSVENLREQLGPRCELIQADIRDPERLREALRDATTVYHLACLGVRHSIHSPLENHEVNAAGTLGVLLAARAQAVRRFVYVSTSEVYGTARTVPMTEDHPTFPETVYGGSKLAGEAYARAFYRTYRFPTVVVRPFNTYGPRCHHGGDSGEVIPRFLLWALAGRPLVIFGDGTQTRDFSYVQDTARGIRRAGMVDAAVGETLNLGSGRELSIAELASAVTQLVGRAETAVRYEEARPGDVGRLLADASRARDLLDYEPHINLTEGLARLRQWYLSSGHSPEELLRAVPARNWESPAFQGEKRPKDL
jgi:UDP-glucose 4-epimerase